MVIYLTFYQDKYHKQRQHNNIMEANQHQNHDMEVMEKMWKSFYLPFWMCKEEKGTIFDDIDNLRKVDA